MEGKAFFFFFSILTLSHKSFHSKRLHEIFYAFFDDTRARLGAKIVIFNIEFYLEN